MMVPPMRPAVMMAATSPPAVMMAPAAVAPAMMTTMATTALHQYDVVGALGRRHRRNRHRGSRRRHPDQGRGGRGNQQAFHDNSLLQRLCAHDNINTAGMF